MHPPASLIFEFLKEHRSFEISRFEISSDAFHSLRVACSRIVRMLNEDDTPWTDISEPIRCSVAEWLTVPVPFDASLFDVLAPLGSASETVARWGLDIAEACDLARASITELVSADSTMRAVVRHEIQQLVQSGKRFRIFCHNRAQAHFESLLPDNFDPAGVFLHSAREYRDVEPFDVLMKTGPLRSRGWGSVPDAVLSAPRFCTLLQVVWTPSHDEEGFGLDPAFATTSDGAACPPVRWSRSVTSASDATLSPAGIVMNSIATDDEIFRPVRARRGRRAIMIQIDEEHGVLYPMAAEILTFAPREETAAIGRRLASEQILPGMFLVLPLVTEANLGDFKASDGPLSRIWREHLRHRFVMEGAAFVETLRAAGLTHVNLKAGIEHWLRRPGTVIHAPQRRKHFEILIHALNCADGADSAKRADWIRRAWAEVTASRGEAIQTGMQESDIIDEELVAYLTERRAEVEARLSLESSFDVVLPEARGLSGTVRFVRIVGVEDGFYAPEDQLLRQLDLSVIDQWRD